MTIALITGAAHGIGFEVSRQLAARGWDVILTARTADKAEAAAATLASKRVSPMALDVTDQASVRDAAQSVARRFGCLDVLVNNAALYADWNETASVADLARARDVMDTNLMGPWRVSQEFLPLIRQSDAGRIVMVASGAGSHGDTQFGLGTGPGSASYAISKAALLALMTKLATELAKERILVNAVCPGLTATAPGMEAMGARPIVDGAKSVIYAATLEADGPTGGFYRDGKPLPW